MAVDILTWLTTFQNQRHLAHTSCILLSVGLLFTGFGCFAFTGFQGPDFDDFDGKHRRIMLTWMTALVGMLASAANVTLYGRIARLDKFDPLATEESMSIKRTTTCIIGAIALTILTVAEFALSGAAGSEGFVLIPFMSTLTGCVTILTTAYDLMYLIRPNRISLDEATNVPLEHDEFDP